MSDQKEPTHCIPCFEPLVKINFKQGYYLVCDNVHCPKYRERQHLVITEPDAQAYMTKRGKYVFRERSVCPSDKNTRRREHYAYARSHGLPSVQAGAICGNSLAYINSQIALYQGELAGAGRI